MGALGWDGEEAATNSWGTTTAALPCSGQGSADFRGRVVVVVGTVVVVDEGTVVVVDGGTVVVVDEGAVVVVEVATAGVNIIVDAATRAARTAMRIGPRRNQ
jgi:hypothetical protein